MMLCVATTQAVITLVAWPAGRLAGSWGRKPLLLIGFGVLPIRGVLYTLTQGTYPLVSIQILDGVGAGIFNVVAVLVIADLTRGTGRFNVTQGAIFTAVGIGAALSQTAAGAIVERFGYHAGFLFLAAVAAVGFGILWCSCPRRDHQEGSATLQLTHEATSAAFSRGVSCMANCLTCGRARSVADEGAEAAGMHDSSSAASRSARSRGVMGVARPVRYHASRNAVGFGSSV